MPNKGEGIIFRPENGQDMEQSSEADQYQGQVQSFLGQLWSKDPNDHAEIQA